MKYISLNWTLALKFSIRKKKRMRDCRILMVHDCIQYSNTVVILQEDLRRESLLLTLVICNYNSTSPNLYRRALFTFEHKGALTSSSNGGTSFNTDIQSLYDFFCQDTVTEEKTLLLYMLLYVSCVKHVLNFYNIKNSLYVV